MRQGVEFSGAHDGRSQELALPTAAIGYRLASLRNGLILVARRFIPPETAKNPLIHSYHPADFDLRRPVVAGLATILLDAL